ncbi:malonyl CoA-acyl carrier protein transacylase [Thiomicrorhabdus immobilis]|uniref:Malonyl CoA-acyl carrier protein transacylase n=1 Tax=Thiomicrorhabdus immobilis TaxID=2791037 RepID=A0ABM7MCL1_9GAMM|nr:ACP S-malonyltransferase [Thiomicrorhabdus immobilis]BCN93055.1 malonyl CoA-acyl carrier protein transacylase [Thiomicrorhabdus immobilis]
MSYAFVFPGQGSQSVGMLAELAESHPQVQEVFSEASDALGYDLWDVVQNDADGKLNQTDVTQPAMLASGIAVYRTLAATKPLAPSFMTGHSLGEYTALVASGCMTLAQGVALVAQRGKFMQSAVPAGQGAMAAVLGLEDAQVVAVCEQAEGVVEAVNFNSPGQVVIAGNKAAVDAAMELATEAGASRVVPLPVSVPSHCSLMKPAADQLAETLATMELSMPSVPVLHNVNFKQAQSVDEIKELLVQQLYRPVQWVETVNAMKAQGVDSLYELGPGKVLMGLNRRIDRKMGMQAVFDNASLEKALASL